VSNALSPVHHQNTDVHPSDKLEWQTWGGGGLGDPLTRPAETVAIEVRRRLVTIAGAEKNYGVVINPTTLQVDEVATETLRADVERAEAGKEAPLYDRGGSRQGRSGRRNAMGHTWLFRTSRSGTQKLGSLDTGCGMCEV
jgi:5-oxoprolinase (ATP-hydrolysing)